MVVLAFPFLWCWVEAEAKAEAEAEAEAKAKARAKAKAAAEAWTTGFAARRSRRVGGPCTRARRGRTLPRELTMADPFTLLFLMLRPNDERAGWTAVQAAWRAVDREIEPDDDDRDDSWPVTKRRLGRVEGIVMTIGIRGHAETYVEAIDPSPLEPLECDVGPSSALSRFTIHRCTTGDEGFDEHFVVRANDEPAAIELLGGELRAALAAVPSPMHFQYRRGAIRITWSAAALEPRGLEAVLDAVIAACKRSPHAPYR
jgi:hypothetical protein